VGTPHGTGWIIFDERSDRIIAQSIGRIKKWPSSTRAELGAIVSTLLVLPLRQKATIHTDSKAAMDSLKQLDMDLKGGKSRSRIWSKATNSSLTSSIRFIIDRKNLDISFRKVKGHSGDKGNDMADSLASRGNLEGINLDISEEQKVDIRYEIEWDNNRIDRPLRKFIDQIAETTNDIAWTLNRKNRDLFLDFPNQIEWDTTWATWKSLSGPFCITNDTNSAFIRHTKVNNCLLPTLEMMKERRYDLYKDVKCLTCLTHYETQDHLVTCTGHTQQWSLVHQECIQATIDKATSFMEQSKITAETCDKLTLWLNTSLFAHHHIPIFSDYLIDHLLLKNFFPKNKSNDLKQILRNDRDAKIWGTIIIRHFSEAFNKIIWKPRCNQVKEWERSKNITQKDLKRRPHKDAYIPYSQDITHDIDNLTYDHKNRRLITAREQWELALSKTRKFVNLFVHIGHVEVWKVSKRIKGIVNFLGG